MNLKNWWSDTDNHTYAFFAGFIALVVFIASVYVPGFGILGGVLAEAAWVLAAFLYIKVQRWWILALGVIAAGILLMYVH